MTTAAHSYAPLPNTEKKTSILSAIVAAVFMVDLREALASKSSAETQAAGEFVYGL
ncbi:hypothetical protein [Noviherbaspirillum suwonense]|jgi:hypothetical protein|uniref:Uncharacterized protein n=1 Tax=Noviherbaspirillum suwonense TaxID=1224511 RepID=A0ABY1Q3X9_9BURK|nr:hypothetical protein [Noviherbaspirillum suwonense]SMP57598.1 hypothetical protein SAMN06295970_105123 [Noviherbaspirillum suwonense]